MTASAPSLYAKRLRMSRLEDLGEQGFLEQIAGWVRTKHKAVKVGLGDDALVLADGTVVTSDSYAESLHFSRLYFSPEDIGFKSAGATLSDLAAMGAEPVCLLVNLFAPGDLEVEFARRIYLGMEELTGPLGCEIAGGDTVASDKLILSCTALGKAVNPFLRSGAKPGDRLYISGFPGLSVVGQRVLCLRTKVEGFEQARGRHLRPEPRIELGLALQGRVSACMDVSDGISSDAGRLAKASGVKLIIEHETLLPHPEVLRFIEQYGGHWDSLVLNGGEDFELLFTSSNELAQELAGLPIHRIGRIEEGEGAFLEIEGELKPLQPRGWDHFVTRD